MATIQLLPQLEKSLLLSIEQYQVVLQRLQLISQSLTVNESTLQDLVQKMSSQQMQAQQHDAELLEMIREAAPSISDHPLYLQRKALIEEVIELNHLLLPKINGMMALVSHELTGLKKGRTVLGGYKQTTHKQGRLVKSSA